MLGSIGIAWLPKQFVLRFACSNSNWFVEATKNMWDTVHTPECECRFKKTLAFISQNHYWFLSGEKNEHGNGILSFLTRISRIKTHCLSSYFIWVKCTPDSFCQPLHTKETQAPRDTLRTSNVALKIWTHTRCITGAADFLPTVRSTGAFGGILRSVNGACLYERAFPPTKKALPKTSPKAYCHQNVIVPP